MDKEYGEIVHYFVVIMKQDTRNFNEVTYMRTLICMYKSTHHNHYQLRPDLQKLTQLHILYFKKCQFEIFKTL